MSRRVSLRVLAVACVAAFVLIPVASGLGDPNAGDVWVDNVGQPSGPGHEQDPHLACQDINLWGSGLADSSGTYAIDGWPPSGSQEQDYASTWHYDQSTGGSQVMDVISVKTLIANAIANGDAPQNGQGFHFKLQFSADPLKHKAFWVNCSLPAISTNASSATIGQPVHDVATISGGNSPTGTISWNVYSASDTTCSSPLNKNSLTATVNGDGNYTSPNFTPLAPGGYQWVATYSGDTQNLGVSTSCNDPNEVSIVTKASPGIVTKAASTTLGGSMHDVATVSDGFFPSGTITWEVYNASDTSCSSPVNKTPLTATVSGDGDYTSPNFTPSIPGSYQWVAFYSGDGNNNPAATQCNDPNEVSTVSKAGPTIATNASSAAAGKPLVDVATLSGGDSPTGSITWNVYAAGTSCATSLDTVTATVNGDGTYTSPGFTPTTAGSYQWVASYGGDANNNSVTSSCNDPNEVSTVGQTSPAIATTASSATAGGSIHDVATLSGGDQPTGMITWNVYAAGSGCITSLDTVTGTVNGDGTYTSPDYTPAAAGSYQWVASYGGDANNSSVSSSCSDPNEVSTVGPASPAIATTASPGMIGGPIHDQATLTGGDNPTGTITWNVYSASDGTCSNALNKTPLTATVKGDGTYTSPNFTPAAAGSYQWVARYGGDGNNGSATTDCMDPNEVSTVAPATPAIATNASSGIAGGPVHDVATLTGGYSPTGTITWHVYSTSDKSCSAALATPALTATVNGDGTYTSPDYSPGAGSYQWVATYSGDGNNNSVVSQCNDPNEVSTVSPATPAIATTASSGTAGGPVHDVATLSGGDAPTGTITWNVYAAGGGCATSLDTVTATVNGDGTYTSPDYTPGAGSYQWVASYGGDENNNPVASQCNDAHEVSSVSPATPAIATTASSATVGGALHDVATLSAGDSPTGTITWNVYTAGSGCATSLDTVTATVNGDGAYTSPNYTPAAAGSYQWVARYGGDGNNNPVASQCNDPNEVSNVSVTPAPGIRVLKLQRVGSAGTFTRGTVTARVGQTIQYEIQVTNTGNTPLALSLKDPHCDAGTIHGPFAISGTLTGDVLSSGSEADYTCSHVLSAGDSSVFTNTATVSGQPPTGPPVSGTSSVSAKRQAVKAITVIKCGRGKVKHATRMHGKTVTVCVATRVKAVVVHPHLPLPQFTG